MSSAKPWGQQSVRTDDGTEWRLDWGGYTVPVGSIVWVTPLRPGSPYAIVIPGEPALLAYSDHGPTQ